MYLKGVKFEKQQRPKELPKKNIPNKFTLDSPAGLLFENNYFKQFAKENNWPIDLDNFEKRYFWIDSKALRVTICDGDINVTYEQMEELIDYLNSLNLEIDNKINFDDIVRKYR